MSFSILAWVRRDWYVASWGNADGDDTDDAFVKSFALLAVLLAGTVSDLRAPPPPPPPPAAAASERDADAGTNVSDDDGCVYEQQQKYRMLRLQGLSLRVTGIYSADTVEQQ
eukprot:CAMPEP_0178552934 /NCGR_PEP_ID=MMETSP0697-20121206/7554_1 /TAXON_ID=265572 /ORGANISM="Extubocellulus spinifer, Strain CCMP396" /LENGTH=111 /DNA_ID=CAMNT_0020185829 /DNA_START=239 /DNA_END=571 /DNA_ORIENTATION=-